MERKADGIYNSETDVRGKGYPLASGYISRTTILFEKENVAAVIQAKGSVEFYDSDGMPIAVGKVPSVEDGKGVYEEVYCLAESNLLKLRFPVYQWIDHYPNCDGEHDRWDTRIVGYHTLTLDLSAGSVCVTEEFGR